MGLFGGKKKKEAPTLTDVSGGRQVGGQMRAKKQAPRGKNLISKQSARYARAKTKNM